MLQHCYGPRCFVPKQLLPPKYDYHRPLPAGSQRGDIEMGDAAARECVICFSPVDTANKQECMLTPCSHLYHTRCLERWMAVKLECPCCRSPLPPP